MNNLEYGKGFENSLNNLIAKKERVRPEEVTVGYIHEQRESGRFDDVRYFVPGLICFTRNELKEIEVLVDLILERI
ncbi:MAG: hypothetical protein KJ858_00660 [Nanoarchaeota archaeon]|nr:hypothetical protein [Nanoarchaeota archaeon]